jgi:deoxyadenosine/deoxycytidine kinase
MSSSDTSPPDSPFPMSPLVSETLESKKILVLENGLPGSGKTTLGTFLNKQKTSLVTRFYPETAHKDVLDAVFGSGFPMSEILAQFQQIMFQSCGDRANQAIKKLMKGKYECAIIDRCLWGNRVFAINSRYNSTDITPSQLEVYLACSIPRIRALETTCRENNISVLPVYLWADVKDVLERLAKRNGTSIEVEKYDSDYYNNLERVHFIQMLSKTPTPFSRENIIWWENNEDTKEMKDFFLRVLSVIETRPSESFRKLKIGFRLPTTRYTEKFDKVHIHEVTSVKELLDPAFIAKIKKAMAFKRSESERSLNKRVLHWIYCLPEHIVTKQEFTETIYGESLDIVY